MVMALFPLTDVGEVSRSGAPAYQVTGTWL